MSLLGYVRREKQVHNALSERLLHTCPRVMNELICYFSHAHVFVRAIHDMGAVGLYKVLDRHANLEVDLATSQPEECILRQSSYSAGRTARPCYVALKGSTSSNRE